MLEMKIRVTKMKDAFNWLINRGDTTKVRVKVRLKVSQ